MPKFNDSNNIPALLEDGDYIYTVTEFSSKVMQAGKTSGSDAYEMTVKIAPTGKPIPVLLIDHPSCDWKIDTFVKSAGVQLAKGQGFEFIKTRAEHSGVPWVDPIGLRGWCHVSVKTIPANPPKYPNTRDVNEVAVFYTDKEKLSRDTTVTQSESKWD
jgi:hypothetical protein